MRWWFGATGGLPKEVCLALVSLSSTDHRPAEIETHVSVEDRIGWPSAGR